MIFWQGILEEMRPLSGPRYLRLYRLLRGAIVEGRLSAGAKMPASRILAKDLKIARNSVVSVYEMLASEGYLESRQGAGTFVSSTTADHLSLLKSVETKQGLFHPARRLSDLAQSHLDDNAASRTSTGIFAPGTPALEEFPFELWARLLRRHWRKPDGQMTHSHPQGLLSLREGIANYLRLARGLRCQADQVIITAGSQQGLSVALRAILNPGEGMWIEDPGFAGTRHAIRRQQITAHPVLCDQDGFDIEKALRQAPNCRAALVTPSRNHPLGVTMSLARRFKVLEWAYQSGGWIVEDDYDSEFRYDERPISSLQGLDDHNCVVYAGTFSRAFFPGLRLGYLVVPMTAVAGFCSVLTREEGGVSTIAQAALADFLNEGFFNIHIRRLRQIYQQRRDLLLGELQAQCADWLTPVQSDGGMHLVALLHTDINDVTCSAALQKVGLNCPALSSYFHTENHQQNGLVLSFGAHGPEEIKAGVRLLRNFLQNCMGRGEI